MKKLLLSIFLPSCGILMPACSVNPTVTRQADGSMVATTGGSIFTKASAEAGEISLPDGTRIAFNRVNKDEVSGVTNIARNVLLSKVAIHGLDSTTAVKHDEQVTQRAATAGSNAVKQSKIAADVTKATFVPPETPVQP